jgi:hypothetical protein
MLFIIGLLGVFVSLFLPPKQQQQKEIVVMDIKVIIKSVGNVFVGDTITSAAGRVLDTVRASFTYELLTADGKATGDVYDGETIAAFRKDATGVAHPFSVGQTQTATVVLSTKTPGLWWPRFAGLGRRAITSDALKAAGYQV